MMVQRSQIAEFVLEWARMVLRGVAFIAVAGCGITLYWLAMLFPLHAAAYVGEGLLPGQAGIVPIAGGFGWPLSVAWGAWIVLLITGAMAAAKTFGSDESNGGDSA